MAVSVNLPMLSLLRSKKQTSEDFFKEAGQVVNVTMIMGRDGQTGQFDEFAYVEFSSIEEADKAKSFHGRYLLGREVHT